MTENKKFVITETEFCKLIAEREQLYKMLSNFVVMFKHEEKLKKHHRPYLHVRAEMDKMCDGYLKFLADMQVRIKSDDYPVTVLEDGKDCSYECVDIETDDGNEIIEVANILVGDLITLVEFVDVLRHMIALLESGVDLGEVPAKFNRFLNEEFDEMMERWDKMLTEIDHESE